MILSNIFIRITAHIKIIKKARKWKRIMSRCNGLLIY